MNRTELTTRLNQMKTLLADSSMDEATRAQMEELVADVEELLAKADDVDKKKAS
jgi:hypothetical protein